MANGVYAYKNLGDDDLLYVYDLVWNDMTRAYMVVMDILGEASWEHKTEIRWLVDHDACDLPLNWQTVIS